MHTYLQLLYKDIKELIIKLVILVRPNFIFKGKKHDVTFTSHYFINSKYNHLQCQYLTILVRLLL